MESRILNVSFSAKRPEVPGEEFYQPQYLRERVYLHRADLATLATVEVSSSLLFIHHKNDLLNSVLNFGHFRVGQFFIIIETRSGSDFV